MKNNENDLYVFVNFKSQNEIIHSRFSLNALRALDLFKINRTHESTPMDKRQVKSFLDQLSDKYKPGRAANVKVIKTRHGFIELKPLPTAGPRSGGFGRSAPQTDRERSRSTGKQEEK